MISLRNRVLNTASLAVGVGITACLFLSISRFLGSREKATPRVQEEDLDMVAVALPTPPPPPKPEEKPVVAEEAHDAVALGFQEEPSSSPVKIAPSPPSYEELLPMSQMPTRIVSGSIGFDVSLKPKMDVSSDNDHVFQRSEVDKAPYVVSRPDPPVPARLLGDRDVLSVLLLFVVDAHGVVANPHVLRSSGNPEFDSIIANSVCEWAFSPAIRKGKAVRCMIQQQVKVEWSGHSNPFSCQ